MNRLDWDDVRFFLALTRAGTLSGAAVVLGVSHVTVSRRIARMEEELGRSAFEKTPGGFVLTSFGEHVLEAAKRAEDSMLHLLRVSKSHDDEIRGEVCLALSALVGLMFGMPLAAELRERHPELELEFLESPSLADLERQEADLAIRLQLSGEFPGTDTLVIRRLGTLDWAMFGSESLVERTGIERLDRVDGVPVVLYSDRAPGRPDLAWMKGRGTPRVVTTSNSAVGLLGAAIDGVGFAACPAPLARKYGLRQVSEPVASAQVYLIIHPDMRRSARVRAVADFIQAYCAARPEFFGTT